VSRACTWCARKEKKPMVVMSSWVHSCCGCVRMLRALDEMIMTVAFSGLGDSKEKE